MGMKNDIENREDELEISFAEVEKTCENLKKKGYKIMVVYQPITGGTIATAFYKSMLSVLSGEVWNYMADKHKVILKPYVSPHFPIDANRNMAVLDARERYKADYMFFMDTDQTFPALTIQILYEALLEKQKTNHLSVMAGMYFAKKDPWGGVFGRYSEWDEKTEPLRSKFEEMGLVHEGKQLLWWKSINFWEKNQIFPVDVIGAGCMMMPMGVFDAIEMPFFKYLPDFQKVGKMASEDMWYCAQLKKAGIPIWMNAAVSCGHLTGLTVDESLHSTQRDEFFKQTSPENAKKTYEKMIDVRSPAERAQWRNAVLKEDLGDE